MHLILIKALKIGEKKRVRNGTSNYLTIKRMNEPI